MYECYIIFNRFNELYILVTYIGNDVSIILHFQPYKRLVYMNHISSEISELTESTRSPADGDRSYQQINGFEYMITLIYTSLFPRADFSLYVVNKESPD